MPLPPNGKAGSSNAGKSAGGLPSMISIAGSTGLVLGIFLLLVWIVRRKTPQALVRLPGEAFEVLGRAPLSGRQQVQLLRCGNRLLLVSVTPGGAETLTEITDPAEVDRLCRPLPAIAAGKFLGRLQANLRAACSAPARQRPNPRGTSDEPETARAGYRRGGRRWEDRDV